MEPQERAPLFQPRDLLWIGVALAGVLLLGAAGRPVPQLAWGFAVAFGAVVGFAYVRRHGFPLWPAVLFVPVVVFLPDVLSRGGDSTIGADLAAISGPLLLLVAVIAGLETLIRRDERRERVREEGLAAPDELEELEAEAGRDLRLLVISAIAALVLAVLLAVSVIRDGGWVLIPLALAPVVVPELWRRLRRPKPGMA